MSSATAPEALDGFPVLAEVARRFDLAGRRPFLGWQVLLVQHAHSSLQPLVDALLLGGASPADVTVVAKAYSARRPVVEALRRRGVRVVDSARMRDPLRTYEVEVLEDVAGAVDGLEAGGGGRTLLVLDEGAIAARALHERPAAAARARVVEQTTRGARWEDVGGLRCPVVDVARSAAKATRPSSSCTAGAATVNIGSIRSTCSPLFTTSSPSIRPDTANRARTASSGAPVGWPAMSKRWSRRSASNA